MKIKIGSAFLLTQICFILSIHTSYGEESCNGGDTGTCSVQELPPQEKIDEVHKEQIKTAQRLEAVDSRQDLSAAEKEELKTSYKEYQTQLDGILKDAESALKEQQAKSKSKPSSGGKPTGTQSTQETPGKFGGGKSSSNSKPGAGGNF